MFQRAIFALACSLMVVAAACGGDDDGGGTATQFTATRDAVHPIAEDDRQPVNAVPAASDYYVGTNNFVLGITDKDDQPVGGAKAKATFFDLRDPSKPKPVTTVDLVQSAPAVGPITQHTHTDGTVHLHGGEDDGRVGYYATVTFDHAGQWGVLLQATLKDGTTGDSSIAFQVYAKPNMRAPGQKAPLSDNLTKADVQNISEIDSGVPPNDMHDVKIKDAIKQGKPLVVVFATPAYCTSRFCGPVVQEVEDLQEAYGDKMDFVHIEIWRDFDKKLVNPTVNEWLTWPDGSIREPLVYVVDKNGTIYDRWEGPVARNIMEPSVKAVANGATK